MNALTSPPHTLVELEAVIDRGLSTFVEVGQALALIRDTQLYREQGHPTFEDYCRQRWGIGRSQGYRLIDAAQVTTFLSTADTPPPAHAAHAAHLAPLLRQDETALVETWRTLRQQHGDRLTVGDVKAAVTSRLSRIDRQHPTVTPLDPPDDPVDPIHIQPYVDITTSRAGLIADWAAGAATSMRSWLDDPRIPHSVRHDMATLMARWPRQPILHDDQRLIAISPTGDTCTPLTAAENVALRRLMTLTGAYVSLDDLMRELWGHNWGTEGSTKKLITSLRRKLITLGWPHDILLNERGAGWAINREYVKNNNRLPPQSHSTPSLTS